MKKLPSFITVFFILGFASAYAVKNDIHKKVLGSDSTIVHFIEKSLGHNPPELKKGMVGKTAPSFTLAKLSGGKLSLDEYKGKLVLLNFWASWCPPCRAEIPGFIEVQHQYKDSPFTILGVAIEDKEDVETYAKEVGINYPITFGTEAAYNVSGEYGNPDGALPYSVLISPEQKILSVFHGFLSDEKLIDLIQKNIPSKQASAR